MNEMKALDRLGPVAEEMLGGLHAGEAMKRRVRLAAAQEQPGRWAPRRVWMPAACCAALALVCVGIAGGSRLMPQTPEEPVVAARQGTVQIKTIAAGAGDALPGVSVADLGEGASVRAAAPREDSLFATASGDIPMVSVGGAVYRLLTSPQDMGDSLRGEQIGTVQTFTQEPSLASEQELENGVSNVAEEGAAVYAVTGMSSSTAVACEVDGRLRLFQRVSHAGRGPGGQSLEDTFSVRGQVRTMELSSVGALSGDAANEVVAVLLDHATLTAADQTAGKQTLTVTLDNGLRLQLGVSGDTLCGCGGWSCPEFFEAFEAAL